MRDEERLNLMREINELKTCILNLEKQRESAREDITRLAAWLKLRHPAIFKAYFLTHEKV